MSEVDSFTLGEQQRPARLRAITESIKNK